MAPRPTVWALKRLLRGATLMMCLGLASQGAAQQIVAAEYGDPTDRYPHGVLGDDLEWASLRITLSQGGVSTLYRFDAPPDLVFEDLAPRLWDLTGDGQPEVVVIQSHQRLGARLLVIGVQDGALSSIGDSGFIGTRFRWLAPVGAADFDGDGRIEVAFVDRPHLAKTLRVFEWDGAALVLDDELPALTNHRIGQDFITSGVRDCGAGPEMITADGSWRSVMVTRMDGGVLSTRALAPFSPQAVARALECQP